MNRNTKLDAIGMLASLDLGTTNSVAALMNVNGTVTYCVFRDGYPSVCIYSQEEVRAYFGKECLDRMEAIDHPEDVIRSIKTMIRKSPEAFDKTVTSGGKQFKLRDVLEMLIKNIISEMRKRAKNMTEIENPLLKGFTVTVPVGIDSEKMTATDYNEVVKEIVVDATELNEDLVHVIEEPVAAAISYLYKENIHTHYSKPQQVLVFDLGGGTLDVSIVKHDPNAGTYTVIAKEGKLDLGGNDFSNRLEKLVVDKCDVDINSMTPSNRARLKEQIEKCKHRLSDEDEANIRFEYGGKKVREFITRKEFEDSTADLLEETKALTQKAVKQLDGGVKGLDMIVLVGGGAIMPQIKRGIVECFPEYNESKILIDDPFNAIARGAAIYSQIMLGDGITGPVDVFVDAVNHTYGFNCKKHGIEGEYIYNLLFKGTEYVSKISKKATIPFSAQTDDQKQITFKVYESDFMPEDCEEGHWYPLSESNISNGMSVTINIPNKYFGNAREYIVYVEFCLKNGILEMEVTDENGNLVGYCKQS